MNEIRFAWYQGKQYPVACGHWGERYPQVDSYKADIEDDYTLVLLCDECNEEGAQDI